MELKYSDVLSMKERIKTTEETFIALIRTGRLLLLGPMPDDIKETIEMDLIELQDGYEKFQKSKMKLVEMMAESDEVWEKVIISLTK